MNGAAIAGAFATVLFLLIGQMGLVRLARRRNDLTPGDYRPGFWDILVTSDDGRYSLSRLQMYLWTVSIAIAFVAVFFQCRQMPDIPRNLYLLMGVNLAATVASTAINTARDEKTVKSRPDFVRDIFFESENSLDLPRSQMFVWTVISLVVFAVVLLRPPFGGGSCPPHLPEIPDGLVALMGISHGAYLGAKAAAKKNENGRQDPPADHPVPVPGVGD